MDVRQLRYFVIVAEKGSFTKAADILGIAQPSLGMQVRNLEHELHCQLLVRTSQGVQLTISGRALFDGAQRIISDMTSLKKRLPTLRESHKGR